METTPTGGNMLRCLLVLTASMALAACGSRDSDGDSRFFAGNTTEHNPTVIIHTSEPSTTTKDTDPPVTTGAVKLGSGHISAKLDSDVYQRGSPIRIILEWQGLSQYTSVRAILRRPQSERFRYDGVTRSMILPGGTKGGAITITGSGTRTVEWPGRGFDCWEIDYDAGCGNDTAEVGRYFIMLNAGSARIRTPEFRIEGIPDFAFIKHKLFLDVMNVVDSSGLGTVNYEGSPRDIVVRAQGDGYCFDVPLERQYKSPITFCYPSSRLLDERGVFPSIRPGGADRTVTVEPAKGVISRASAIAKAREIASAPYRARVANLYLPGRTEKQIKGPGMTWSLGIHPVPNPIPAAAPLRNDPLLRKTYLYDPMVTQIYREDLGGWIIGIQESMWTDGDQIANSHPAMFSDIVQVFVPNHGPACIVDKINKLRQTRQGRDMKSIVPACARSAARS
jgi:hypothetical protein